MRVSKIIILIMLLSIGCSEEEKTKFQAPKNIKQLIAGDSSKTWKLARRYNGRTRMNMGDCFLKYRQTFTVSGDVYDNNSANSNCGESLKGIWSIVKDTNNVTYIRIESSLIPELFKIDQEYKDFKIFYANQDSLQLSFYHTQYGQGHVISDYLVTESTEVDDRDFHY